MSRLLLDPSWSAEKLIVDRIGELFLNLSTAQRALMTPVFVNSTTLEILKDAYLQLFKQSGVIYTPSAFRYSYSFRVADKNIMATTKYHLEKDFNLMKDRYNIVIHAETLKLSGAKWERAAYDQLRWFEGTAAQAVNKLITCKGKDAKYYGWYFKEVFPDNPVK